MPAIPESLTELFDVERKARLLHASIVNGPREEVIEGLRTATRDALGIEDDDEAALRLTRLALVLGDMEGDDVVDLLIDIMASDHTEARVTAGEALEALAFDRFKEVALGIERALVRLKKGSPALTELPFLLAEVGEPGCTKLLGRFLKHEDPEAVAAAIEAMAELGDPAAIPLLAPLEKDGRHVQIDDEEGGERVAIGDLAHEAREILTEMAGEVVPQPSHKPRKK